MIAQINWKPSSKDLRKFGIAMIIGFGIIGGLLCWRHHPRIALWLWGIGGGVGLLAVVAPPLSKPFYWAWMGVAFILGTVISSIILFLIFYAILTPVGLFMKIIGRDALKLKKSSFKEGTYWHKHPDISDKHSFERLF